MKQIILIISLVFFLTQYSYCQDTLFIENIKKQIIELEYQNKDILNRSKRNEYRYIILKKEYAQLEKKLEELSGLVNTNSDCIKITAKELGVKIENTDNIFNQKTTAVTKDIKSKTIWGMVSIFLIFLSLAIIYLLFGKRLNNNNKSINIIKERQQSLQEKALKLDLKLIEIFENQINNQNTKQNIPNIEADHSLVVKLTDEIARIETNLSKMDKSVKGYKQLVQAKDRMINNVRANGYEIISLMGQDYNDGMQFEARFIPDDTLAEGKRIITGMIKMQVNYNGNMIQPAHIVVSQNI